MSDYVKKPLSEAEMAVKLDEIRNNVAKKMDKWADRIQVSMAFTPKIQRMEGERWKENGKLWEMKNGIKMSVTSNQDARMPWWCPKCSVPMNHRFDRKFYYLRGWCYNCNIEFEGKMRLEGTWEAFEKRAVRENEKSWLKDKITEHMEYIRTFKAPQVHFENGGYEVIAQKTQFKVLFEKLEQDVEAMTQRLEQIAEEERLEVEAQQQELINGNNQVTSEQTAS